MSFYTIVDIYRCKECKGDMRLRGFNETTDSKRMICMKCGRKTHPPTRSYGHEERKIITEEWLI